MFTFVSSFFSSRPSYSKIEVDDIYDQGGFMKKTRYCHSIFGPTWPWVFSTVIFALAFATLFINDYVIHQPFDTFEFGFNTELYTATNAISLEKIGFTGNIHIRRNKNDTAYESYLIHEPGRKQYVGAPSAEIDANWGELINDRYFWVSEEEAVTMWGDDVENLYHKEGKGYVAGLDILHTLHCVDMMRMLLDSDHYEHALMMSKNHNYHCIDHLRQYLMCNGDLTPVPTKRFGGMGRIYVDSDRPHTCRNFQNILDWVQTREIVYQVHEM